MDNPAETERKKDLEKKGLMMKNWIQYGIVFLLLVGLSGMISQAEEDVKSEEIVLTSLPDTDAAAKLEKTRRQMIGFGINYLRQAQEANGGFSTEKGIGPTLIVLIGLLRAEVSPHDPLVAKGLDYILRAVQIDGGIYSPNGRLSIYESCLALSCLTLAKKAEGTDRFDAILENGEKFIRGEQYSEATGTSKDDKNYGGLGYGKKTRPDLSNTQFFVETLHDLGADFNDEAIQRAVVFVSRCQNLDSDVVEDSEEETKEGDGGFIYTCVTEENPAGQETDGGLRSYGSITYAGLKSLIYAGLTPNDPRVAAATGWIRENYSTSRNPGLAERGLYYYYHTMSKTLDVLKNDLFVDAKGIPHYWKGELIRVFADRQRMDGSWVNHNAMWFESDPNLVTGYALIVLFYCK